jgi:hypothetical protein
MNNKIKPMKKVYFLICSVLLSVVVFSQNLQWAKQLPGNGIAFNNSVESAIDSTGNIYTITSRGGIISKIDSLGNLLWTKSITGNGALGTSIDVDEAGNVYSTGNFEGVCDFDPGPNTYTLTSQSLQSDAYVLKLDRLGNFVWARNIATSGGTSNYNIGSDIQIGSNSSLYITGNFSGTADFDCGIGTYFLTSFSPMSDIFVSKLDTAGNFIWARQFGGTAAEMGYSITSDVLGNVFVSGDFTSAVADFDPGIGVYNLNNTGQNSAFVLKLSNNGDFVFAENFGGLIGYNAANSIKLDLMGNIIVSGYYGGTVDFDMGPGTYTLTSVGSAAAFVLKLDNIGNFIWVKTFEASFSSSLNSSVVYSASVDSANNIYTTGYFQGNVDFDAGIGTYSLSALGTDGFISKIDAAGNFLWAQKIGGTNNSGEQGYSVIHDSKNNVFVTGIFNDVVDFDAGLGIYSITPPLNYVGPVFISKLGPCPTSAYAISGYTSVCVGATTTYSVLPATGATGYIWSTPLNSIINSGISTNSINLTYSSTPGMIIITPTNSCGSGPSSSLTIVFNAPLDITPTSATTCIGSSVTYTASGASTYSWSTGGSSATMNIVPSSSTVYTVNGTTAIGCSGTQTVDAVVDNTCSDVWPGDANSDGLANNLDVLELGLHYGQTGPVRMYQWIAWYALTSVNWMGSITNGKNLSHSDCNGDGTINDNDTLAIYNNYGLTHAFKPVQTTTVNPQLSIVPDQTSVVKGNWGTASIYLGDATANINAINGVAFTVDFDNALIETNSIYIEYQNSFLDIGQNLKFKKLDFSNNKLFTASTHTVSNNVSGFGKIATLHYQIKSSLTTDQVLNIGLSLANQSDASGLITPLTTSTGTLMALGTSVGLQELSGSVVSMNPNPTNGSLTINSKTELQKIEVVSITGTVLLSEFSTNISHTLNLENFGNGMYFVNVYQNNRIVKRERVVLNK